MPKKEQEYLEHFFHFLNIEGFPWIAKGAKPVLTFEFISNIEFTLIYPKMDLIDRYHELFLYFHPTCAHIRAGLRVWKKYSWLFPSNKIAIVSTPPSLIEPCELVLLINRNEAKNVILNNYKNFVNILGYSFSIDNFIERLIQDPSNHMKILKGSHYLMGILYGFGENNSLAFQKRDEPYDFVLPPYLKSYPKIGEYENKELTPFLDKREPFDPNDFWFCTPGFAVIPDTKETKDLEQKYLELFPKISKEKYGKSELKWSLMQLL